MAKLTIELEDGAPWKASRLMQGESKSSAFVRMMRQAREAIQNRLSGKDSPTPAPKRGFRRKT